jgi:murein DD-endopeptidase MepM/ murein hydrolase activator NlpD
MRIIRGFFVLVFLALLGFGVAYYLAGRSDGPAIAINQPAIVGRASQLDVTVKAPHAVVSALDVTLEQQGRTFPILTIAKAPDGSIAKEGADQLRVKHHIGKQSVPELQTGPAVLKVTASRPVFFGLRQATSEARRDLQVRLDPPRLAVVSTHHFINLGGSEMVVYRVSPPDVESGVRVGDLTYPGFAGSGAGLRDPNIKVAFFALLYNQKPATPIELYARDAAGNEARAQFEHRVFPKVFRTSRIVLDDGFLEKVVPSILQQSPELNVSSTDLLPAFLKINNDLRRINNEQIAALARKTAPALLWHPNAAAALGTPPSGAFQSLGGSQVESAFADFRTYIYRDKEVDRQVHLGFDLAKTANAPIAAANDGKVLHADDLGIYGNSVILDHGMGVQSLYAHLSSIQVKEGEAVRAGQTLGLSGQTGLAGGDHLHFSMMVNGQFVNATEWWDAHWIEDRIIRKLREAGAPSPTASAPAPPSR